MENIILFVISIILCTIVRFLTYIFSRKRKKPKSTSLEIKYLHKKFKIKTKYIDKLSFMLLISFIDSIIVTITFLCVIKITKIFVLELLLGLLIAFPLIYIFFEVIGKILQKKGFDKK